MKNIKYITLLFAAIIVTACGDPDLRFEQFEEAKKGAFARNLSGVTGAFDAGNIAGSTVGATVEFYDENQGQNVASYSWTVEYRSNGGNNGNDVAAVSFVTFNSSQFTTNADGLPELTFTLGFQDALDALGIDGLTLAAGDRFRFDATITKTDGSTYGFLQHGPNLISQPPFSALARIDANVVCLFANDAMFTGAYELTLGPTDGVWGGPFGESGNIVTLVNSGATERQFTTPYGERDLGGGFPITPTLSFVCDEVFVLDTDLGASCGGAGIRVGQGASAGPGNFDLFDDTTFTINFSDEVLGDCAGEIPDITYTFVKQ